MTKIDETIIKLFGMNNLATEVDLARVFKELTLEPRRRASSPDRDKTYYPQFPVEIRKAATLMSRHYELFYCLENFIRDLIRDRLESEKGSNWWAECVPEVVRNNAEKNRKKELESGITPRSSDLLAYTNFGELGEVIKANWSIFSDTFSEIRAVENVLARLNTLRAPIAHCSPLSDDEVLRLQLSLRDWFRLMG